MLLKGSLLPTTAFEHQLADAAGLTVSQIKFAIAFFASVLVSWAWRYVPTARGRHLFALLSGFALIYYPFGNGCFHAFVPSTITYFIMWRFRDHGATLAWLVDFLYLIGCHVASASGEAWKQGEMDFTGAQMVLTLKVISAAACYQDGVRPAESLRPYQEAHKLQRLPGLLEWYSYVFAAGNLLSGPFFELREYLDYIERKGDFEEGRGKRIPSGVLPGALRFCKALLCLGLHLRCVKQFPVELLESSWFASIPFYQRIFCLYLVPTIYRYKYYFAWGIAEAGLMFSGFNFNGLGSDSRPRWDRYVNTRIRQVELSTSAAKLPEHWNICTGLFLRQYVYERLTPKGRKPTFLTLIITQLVSGVWHGLFPGYALFFLSSAFMFQTSKVIYRYERTWPAWVQRFPLWALAKWALTAFVLNYSAGAFLILDFEPSIQIWRSVHFLGHWMVLAILLFSMVFSPRKPRKPAAEQQQAREQAQQLPEQKGSEGSGKANYVADTPTAPDVPTAADKLT